MFTHFSTSLLSTVLSILVLAKMKYTSEFDPATQSAATNIDQDVGASRAEKYKNTQKEVLAWIFEVLNVSNEKQREYTDAGADLVDILKDGQLLCQIGNKYGLDLSPTAKCRNSRMPFVQMENIMFFLQFCEMVGVAHDEIFQTIDLFERKDPYQVVVTLMAFSRLASQKRPGVFKTAIGPRAARVKPQVPVKPFKLRL